MIVDIVIFDGTDEMDAIGPLEVLRAAGTLEADIEVRLVTREPLATVTCAYGLQVVPDGIFEAGSADIVIVTGGGWNVRAAVGAWGEVERGEWLSLLQGARDSTATMAGVCTGTMMLAHAGVVGDRRAATHHTAWVDLEATGATLVKDRVVDDGDLVTSGGVTSGIDLALWLVEREFSADIANAVAARMEYHRVRPSTRKNNGE